MNPGQGAKLIQNKQKTHLTSKKWKMKKKKEKGEKK